MRTGECEDGEVGGAACEGDGGVEVKLVSARQESEIQGETGGLRTVLVIGHGQRMRAVTKTAVILKAGGCRLFKASFLDFERISAAVKHRNGVECFEILAFHSEFAE